jgi:ABC-type transport system involved in multi-copper enzyme maturation permease subunit
MTWNIFKFELRYHLKQPLFYILFVIFFLLSFGATVSDNVQIGGAIGNVHRNAPLVIMQFLLVFTIFGVLTAAAYAANSVHRDFELGTDALFFSSPIRKSQYLAGRFLGSFTVGSLVFVGVMSAIAIGSYMPWIDKERVGAFMLKPYLFSFFALVVPNLLFVAAIFFAVAILTRSLLATYTSAIAFYVAYAVAGSFFGNMENERLASLFDPFGFGVFELATRYWTVFEKNNDVLPIAGIFLWNRLIWLAVAAAVLAFAFWRFEMTTGKRTSKRKAKRAAMAEETVRHTEVVIPAATQTFGGAASWRQYLHAASIEVAAIVKSIPFIAILLLAVLNTVGGAVNRDTLFGTPVYPVTHLMIETILGSFLLFTIILSMFFGGEIVWRERSLKLNEVHDAMPQPTWTIWAGKLTALITIVLITIGVACATTIGVQTFKGYHNYELALYAKGAFLAVGFAMILVAILSFFAQAVTGNKFVGFALMLVYFITLPAMPAMHFDHHLYRLFTRPGAPYSDMNGFGHFVAPTVWFNFYWALIAGIMLLAAHLLWTRGTESRFKQRMRIARARFGRSAAAAIAILAAGAISTGCYIYYNTNVLNDYESSDKSEKRSADAEKKYKKYDRVPRPRITDAAVNVDIHPQQRAVDVHGVYTMVNKTAAPIADLHVTFNPDLPDTKIAIPGATPKMNDRDFGYTIYRLDPPLAPGATTTMTFDIRIRNHGFANEPRFNQIVENGTFFNNLEVFPHLGYQRGGELQDRGKRKKYGLAPVQRVAKINDREAWMNSELSHEADWINLDTTVSTSPDQIALAPGYLQREWTANGRRYFHYKTTSPILPFWSYLSARYSVKRDAWHGIPIEIYYDAKHPYNVDRMIYAIKKSLDYFTVNFSPYQHRQVRIVEFPRYARFAQSFPNTIPFSESIGFIADLRDKDEIDYVFYVTAHEVGHQWWAHQVCGADVQGATMITETMAQYSALMVMEKEYGKDQMRRFLKYELNRYLHGRGGELVAEMPLKLVEEQNYIHYGKGSVAMYALRDAIGEDRVNAALRQFIHDHAFAGPPWPTTEQLIAEFHKVAPPEKQQIISDLLETITLWDDKTTSAESMKLPGGKYRVTVTVEAKKMRDDGTGETKPVPLDDWIDIGVLGDPGKSKLHDKVLAMEKRHITQPVSTFEFIVNEKPVKAGIDPLNKLIDRNPEDNTKKVSAKS